MRAAMLDDQARHSQAAFRAAMMAMAQPGRIIDLPELTIDAPLPEGMATLALALCDYETPIWLDDSLTHTNAAAEWLRMQTGAPLTRHPATCLFGLIGDATALPALESFALGTDEYPDRSASLIVAVYALSDGYGWRLRGPGIREDARLHARGLAEAFVAERAGLGVLFPRGVDIFFVCGLRVAALPRSTRVEA